MNKLSVSSVQRGCVFDGPGVRTTIFLKGCTLHCPWCCNPENISFNDENFIDDEKCIFLNGMDSQICIDCERRTGKRSISKCPFGVSVPVAEDLDATEVFDLIDRDKDVFGEKGGVTFSGGEPLMQAKQLVPTLQLCKVDKIHILFETTLFVKAEMLEAVLPYVDGFIVDLKLQPEQGDISKYIEIVRNNLAIIGCGITTYYRLVFVDSMFNAKGEVLRLLKLLRVSAIELIKCHNLGKKKYENLHEENYDFTANDSLYQQFADFLAKNKIEVSLLKI